MFNGLLPARIPLHLEHRFSPRSEYLFLNSYRETTALPDSSSYIGGNKTGIVLLPWQLTNSFLIPPLLKTEQENLGSEA
jgi:hypothetical protein